MTIPHRSGRRRCAARRPARCRPLYRTALLGSDIVAAAHLAEGPMIKCSLGPRQQRLGTTHPHCRSARTAKVLDSNRWHLRSMYIHMWSASSSESRALLRDAGGGARLGLSEGPSCFRPRARAPKAPQPSRPCRSTGSAQTGPQFRFFSISGGPAAKCRARAGTDRPAPAQAEAGDTATQGRPLMIVDLRLSALLAAQAAP